MEQPQVIEGEAGLPGLEGYRRDARAWLRENCRRRTGPPAMRGPEYYSEDVLGASRGFQRRLYDAGYAGISWPKDYGGQGLPDEYQNVFDEEAEAFELPDFGFLADSTYKNCVPTMLAHASPEYLREFVPKTLVGDALFCKFFSEPAAGSDLAGVRTRADRDGDEWVINGQKLWTSFGNVADWGMCLARTDWDATKHRGLTWFAVPCSAPGLTIRPIKQINGTYRFCEEFFDDVRVPDAYRIGDVNDGWSVTQTMLVFERGAGASKVLSPLPGPGPLSPDLVAVAERAGRLGDPVVRQLLATAHANDFVGTALQHRIAELHHIGALGPGQAAYGKVFAGTYNPIRAQIILNVGGPRSFVWPSGAEDGDSAAVNFLNGRMRSIAAGTNEMQRNGIAERVLGMPREPSYDTKKPFKEVLREAAKWADR